MIGEKHISVIGFCGYYLTVFLTQNFCFLLVKLSSIQVNISVLRAVDTGEVLIQNRLLKYTFTVRRFMCGGVIATWIGRPMFFNRLIKSERYIIDILALI
jgi:hypothetical protein